MGVDLIAENHFSQSSRVYFCLFIFQDLLGLDALSHLPPHLPNLGLGWDSLGLCCFSKVRLGETVGGSSLGVETRLELPTLAFSDRNEYDFTSR